MSAARAPVVRGPVHFVGIGGIHMSGLAGILLDDGVAVSGCDIARTPLIDALAIRGATIHRGHHPNHLAGAALVVHTLAVDGRHAEIAAAHAAGIPVIARAQLVARIADGRRALTVAGTHGKTTTATMLTLILQEAGLDPGFVLGGECADLGTHAARGRGAPIVLEADEYGRAFHEYRPAIAVITNIERDHLDYYRNDAALREAFRHYAQTLQPGGTLLVGADSPAALAVAEQIGSERPDVSVQRYGLEPGADWRGERRGAAEEGAIVALVRDGSPLGCLRLAVPGEFNVRNAIAATAAALVAGASIQHAAAALARFHGVQRRFQRTGEAGGVLVMDDYAHHPTAIRATLAAARERFPQRRLLVLFQPHTYSRSSYLLDGFRRCFRGAACVYLTDTYAAREDPVAGLAAADLAAHITDPPARYAGPLEQAAESVSAALRPGDVLFTMGAGPVDAAGPMILERLGAA